MGLATAVPSDKKALFDQGLRWARLHTRAATDAFGFEESLIHSGYELGGKPASVNRQGKGALDVRAGSHASAAHDTLGGIEEKIGVRGIDQRFEMVVDWRVRVRFHANIAKDGVKLAPTAGNVARRKIGKIEFDHPFAEPLEILRLRAHDHTVRDGGRAAGGEAAAPLNLNETDTAAAERLQHVRGAKLRHGLARHRGGEHDGTAGRNGNFDTIDRQVDIWAVTRRRAHIDIVAKFSQFSPHDGLLPSVPPSPPAIGYSRLTEHRNPPGNE